MPKKKIIVIGAGITGLSAAYHLQQNPDNDVTVLEKESRVGGVASSFTEGGFTFDRSIHILFGKNPYAMNLIRELLGDNIIEQRRSAWVYSHGVYTKYPFQNHLYGLPKEVIEECITGFANRQPTDKKDLYSWILATFGEGIAKHFMVPYNEKGWVYDLAKMSSSWIDGRVALPTLEELKAGAYSDTESTFGKSSTFWYPKTGGIQSFSNAFAERVKNIFVGYGVVSIDPLLKHAIVERDTRVRRLEYDALVYTADLSKVASLLTVFLPLKIASSANKLRYNHVVVFNVGVEGKKFIKRHWVYFPEKEIPFRRIIFPNHFSPTVAPSGHFSIQVEISRENKEGNYVLSRPVRESLLACGIIDSVDKIKFWGVDLLSPAYVIPTLDLPEHQKIILDYLKELDIYPCGRFGAWRYLNMDDSLLSGKETAEEIDGKI